MSSQLAVQLTLFVFSLSAGASPARDGRPAIMGLSPSKVSRPRGEETVNGMNVTITPMFSPGNVTRELERVKAKYANAGKILAGIGLNPDTHPERGYSEFQPPNVFTRSPGSAQAMFNTTDADSGDSSGSGSGSAPGIVVAPVENAPGTAQMPLTDYMSGMLDILYYGPMSFGSKQAVLQIDVDTGSADLWVPMHCKGCRNPGYSGRGSTSLNVTTDECMITYGTGKVSGTLASDTVAVGTAAVPQQTFCAVTSVSSDLDSEPNSGLLGLAFGTIAQAKNNSVTFFENLLEQKALTASIFSVHLTRGVEKGSEVCFGCFDPTKARGPVSWNRLVSRTYWSIAMNGTAVNGTQAPANIIAAIDTGTSLIYLPDAIADAFYAMIPGSAPSVEWGAGFYTFPCDTPFTTSLILSGQPYAIHPDDFNLGRTDENSDQCVGGILALGSGFPVDLAIVGDEFLKSWYSVFDYAGRVGFAPSVNNQ
ncbi:acid protease [Lenzites betulinus]|nr:acid protease [Lenzites betulinus]